MPVDTHIKAAVELVARAEEVVQTAGAALGLAVGRAIGEVFDATPDLDAVELWVDRYDDRYDDLMLRAAFRGGARYDAEADCLTEAADVEDYDTTETACLTLGALHDAVYETGALRRWVRDAINAGTNYEAPARFWSRDFDGAPEDFHPGDPLKLVAGRYARHASGRTSGAVVVAFVGPSGVADGGLDVIKGAAPAGDLCLRYTRERRGPVVAAQTIEAP